MFTWPIKWILKKVLVAIVPVLATIGLLKLAGVPVEDFVDELLGLVGGEGEGETTTAPAAAE